MYVKTGRAFMVDPLQAGMKFGVGWWCWWEFSWTDNNCHWMNDWIDGLGGQSKWLEDQWVETLVQWLGLVFAFYIVHIEADKDLVRQLPFPVVPQLFPFLSLSYTR
jgi:hypothetical protein